MVWEGFLTPPNPYFEKFPPLRAGVPNGGGMNPVSIFFYRPFRNASNYCADVIIIPLAKRFQPIAKSILDQAERMRPIANSLMGRIVKSAAAETVCAIAGAAAGELVVGNLCYAMGPQVVPAACVIGLAAAVATKKKPQMVLFTIGLVSPAIFSRGKQAEYFVQAGAYAGRAVGNILGGYVGLTKLAGAKIDLVNRTRPSDSYAVNMLKFQAAGELFDAVIASSSIPYAAGLINLPRNAVKSVIQTLAYNSQSSLPLIRKCVREKRLSLSLPQAVKMVCSRYSVENSRAFASQAAGFVSKSIFPAVMDKMGAILGDHLVAAQVKKGIGFMADHSDQVATALMRGFVQYGDLVQAIHAEFPDFSIDEEGDLVSIERKNAGASSKGAPLCLDPKLLKKALKTKIPGAALLSPVFDRAMKSSIQEWSQALVAMIEGGEREIFGVEILGKERAEVLREFLPIHLKYYLIFVLLNAPSLSRVLTLIEERDFFAAVNGAFFSIYTNSAQPHGLVRCFREAVSLAGEGLYKMRRFIEPEDEETLVAEPIAFADDHFPRAAAQNAVVNGVIAVQEDYF